MEQARVLLVAQTQSDPQMEPKTLDTLMARDVSALIYATIFTRDRSAGLSLHARASRWCCSTASRQTRKFPPWYPARSREDSPRRRTLSAMGHRRIGTIMGEAFMSAAQDRLEEVPPGAGHGRPALRPRAGGGGTGRRARAYDATMKLMALEEPPTAIFCQNDRMAIGCYEALKEMRLRIPRGYLGGRL